ncbi:hypothetical protein Prudu_014020 [Prunus dulcis]|uniref:Uncharacterized protein n=1 Tax=Prunus dulcis TaxID=3755 RepID=A0A4Y1RG15_PRUDU|nr:hypothetical protein Prudu_014020 [Prunus dulcis]
MKIPDYHHYVGGQSQSNFASVFTYCDFIYGTDKGFRYQKKILKKLKEESNAVQNGGSYNNSTVDLNLISTETGSLKSK